MNDDKLTRGQLISEMKELRRRLADLHGEKKDADYDLLTSLPNRTLLYDRLSQAVLQASRKGYIMAVLYLFLNELKLINDTFGRETGDILLKSASERLKNCLRKSDTVARPGRDEFIILLPEIARQEDSMVVAEKILEAFDSPFVIHEREILINIHIGISLFPVDGIDANTLLKKAYTALHNARAEAKNNYVYFSSTMNAKALERLNLESSLRLAIKRKEFLLHYQPQFDLREKRVVGMEALIRWKRPGVGLVSPADFIPAAEDTRLIVPINEWVLYAACKQQKDWQKAGIAPDRVAVNVSAIQFLRKDMIDKVMEILKATGLAPDSLELELTESTVFHNEGDTIASLMKLKEMGVNISIDDFGTGYSSLSYLKQFPVSKLKIVRSFVRSISISTVDSAIAKLIIDLSKVLNLNVIAEGVETDEQLEFLRSLGCNEVQGYLFSRPLDARGATQFLRKTKAALKSVKKRKRK